MLTGDTEVGPLFGGLYIPTAPIKDDSSPAATAKIEGQFYQRGTVTKSLGHPRLDFVVASPYRWRGWLNESYTGPLRITDYYRVKTGGVAPVPFQDSITLNGVASPLMAVAANGSCLGTVVISNGTFNMFLNYVEPDGTFVNVNKRDIADAPLTQAGGIAGFAADDNEGIGSLLELQFNWQLNKLTGCSVTRTPIGSASRPSDYITPSPGFDYTTAAPIQLGHKPAILYVTTNSELKVHYP
jgi:hypothetical protein